MVAFLCEKGIDLSIISQCHFRMLRRDHFENLKLVLNCGRGMASDVGIVGVGLVD